jgi:hypothetical protein
MYPDIGEALAILATTEWVQEMAFEQICKLVFKNQNCEHT